MHDLRIDNALVVDGTGRAPFHGSVAVRDGRIAAVDARGEAARETLDAGGAAVAPGFIDPHTHYDAQVAWGSPAHLLAGHGVDLAIVDIFMPRQDGIVTITEIRRLSPDVPIIAMSAGWHVGRGSAWDAVFDVLDDARTAGATEIVRKPFDVLALCDTVRGLLRRPPP